MRNKRLKNIETLYLLGAGASYALSLPQKGKETLKTTPLDYNFNERILSHKSNKKWVKDAISFHKLHWVGVESLSSLRLEESILKRSGNFDLLQAVHKVKLNGNSKAPAKCENDDYVNNVSHVITEILNGCQQNNQSLATLFAKGLLKKKQVTRGGKRQYIVPTKRVITFNYDTILDKELLEHSSLDEHELYFERIATEQALSNSALERKPKKAPFPYLLKLHGSANWRVSEENYKDIVSGKCKAKERVPIWFDWKKVPTVAQNISPLIVPPLPNKPITTSSIFAHLWQCAFEYLHESKRLVIAGYSCPQTDSFAMSLLSNIKDSKLEEITIIDPNVESITKYKKLLSSATNSKTKWVYYDDFGQYIRTNYG